MLPNLPRLSLIILDNAEYDKSKNPGKTIPSKLKKQEVIDKLLKIGIDVLNNVPSVEAKSLLREWLRKNVKLAIVELAREQSYEVIFTPPHFSDLQPIELYSREELRGK